MIIFDNVTKIYDGNIGLENASIRINKGDFVFLVGPSGAGKSTFIKLILKEINADSGSIKVNGKEVTKLSNREVPQLRRRIGIVWQDFRLLPNKTVFENVAFAMEILHKPKRMIRKKVPQVLSLVGILDQADKYPNELSAGEQQRVAIARAIVNKPTVLIADEPTGNLDPDTAAEIMDLLEQINLSGTTILMVTHAKDIVDRMQKRVVAIDSGHIVRDEFGQYGYIGDEDYNESAIDDADDAEDSEGVDEEVAEFDVDSGKCEDADDAGESDADADNAGANESDSEAADGAEAEATDELDDELKKMASLRAELEGVSLENNSEEVPEDENN